MKTILVSAFALLLGIVSATAGNSLRFALTITGISEKPKQFPVESLGFTVTPVEREDRFEPNADLAGTATSVQFFLPEVDDEVLVAFLNWQRRIMEGRAETHGADLVAYDFKGRPVFRWHLTNTWPSKIAAPTFDLNDRKMRHYAVTLQVDNIRSAPIRDVAPRPDVRPPRVNRETRTVTVSWPSVPGATYDVYGWDPKKKEATLVKENVVATGQTAFINRLMEEEGIFWVVLKSSPKAPSGAQ